MKNEKYDSLVKNLDSTYQKTINKMNDIIEQIRNSQPKGLSLVSTNNIGIFKQLMDLDILFAEYMKYSDACVFMSTELIMNIANICGDDSLENIIINQIKPRIEEATGLFLKASKKYQDQKMKFNLEVFEYIEK